MTLNYHKMHHILYSFSEARCVEVNEDRHIGLLSAMKTQPQVATMYRIMNTFTG